MTVYVDDMKAPYRGMIMCHMIADTTAELFSMVDGIGVARRWIQYAGTPREHFDICRSKRSAAIAAGAVEITRRQAAAMIAIRRAGQPMGPPEMAVKRFRVIRSQRSPIREVSEND